MSSGPSEATSESPNGVGIMGLEESNVGKQDQGTPSAQICAQVDDVEGAYSGQCESRSSNEREELPAGEEALGAQHESVNDSRPSSQRRMTRKKRKHQEDDNRNPKAKKLYTIPEYSCFDVSFESGILRSSTLVNEKSRPKVTTPDNVMPDVSAPDEVPDVSGPDLSLPDLSAPAVSKSDVLDDSFDKIVIDSDPSSLNDSAGNGVEISEGSDQSRRSLIVDKLIFQKIINKRGRPKLSREGRKTPKKKQTSNNFDEMDAIFPPNDSNDNLGSCSGTRYKDLLRNNSTISDMTDMSCISGQSQGRKRGPYKTKNKTNEEYRKLPEPKRRYKKKPKTTDAFLDMAESTKPERRPGPRRAPITMRAMQEQYPNVFDEICSACELALNRNSEEDPVVRCHVCNEVDVHLSCLINCIVCEERTRI